MSSNEIRKEKKSKKTNADSCWLIKPITQAIWSEAPNLKKHEAQFLINQIQMMKLKKINYTKGFKEKITIETMRIKFKKKSN